MVTHHKTLLNKLQTSGRQSLQMRNSSLTGDTGAIVQIYLPTTARDSVLDQADRDKTTQELRPP